MNTISTLRLALMAVVMLVVSIGSSFATNYYVDSVHGSDSNNGALSQPWQSLTKVNVTTFLPGDVISFACGGSWTGGISVKRSGTATQPITYTSYGTGAAPSFTNPNYSVLNSNIFQVQASYIVVNGLYFHDVPGLDSSLVAASISDVKYANLGAVYLATDSGHVTVQNCEAKSVPFAVHCFSQNNLITQNYFHDSNMKVTYHWGPVAVIFGNGAGNCEASYNNIANNWCYSDAYGADGGAFELDNQDPKTTISNMKIHHNYTYNNQGFLEGAGNPTTNIKIYYNYSNNTEKFLGDSYMNNWQVYNNTVLRVLPLRGNADNAVIWFNGHDSNMVFKNNIFVLGNNYTGVYAVGDGSSQIHTNNIYWRVDGSSIDPIGATPGVGEKVANPNFVDYANLDLHLQSNSPAIGDGANLGLTVDLDGNSVPSIPDCGAYEFKAGIQTAPAPVISPASVNFSTEQTVTLSSSISGATIYYTTDGTDPRTSTSRLIYELPLMISTPTTIHAFTVAGGYLNSAVSSATYNLATPPVITSALSASGTLNIPFSYQITATNSPAAYSATGLPAGLTVNTSTGAISGTPTAVGPSNVTITAMNSYGAGSATLVVTVGTVADTNVALNQPSTASSFEPGNLVAYANDGNTTTRWAASSASYPQWWQVDLGSVKTLSRVDIDWYSNATRYYQYTIAVSSDNVTFTTVVNQSTNTTFGATSDIFSTTARYLKVTVTGSSAGWASAYEIGVYGH